MGTTAKEKQWRGRFWVKSDGRKRAVAAVKVGLAGESGMARGVARLAVVAEQKARRRRVAEGRATYQPNASSRRGAAGRRVKRHTDARQHPK